MNLFKVILLSLFLTACSNTPVSVPGINTVYQESVIVLISMGETITGDETSGFLTTEEANAQRAQLRKYKVDLDKAYALGDFTKVSSIQSAILLLRTEVHKRAVKEKQGVN